MSNTAFRVVLTYGDLLSLLVLGCIIGLLLLLMGLRIVLIGRARYLERRNAYRGTVRR